MCLPSSLWPTLPSHFAESHQFLCYPLLIFIVHHFRIHTYIYASILWFLYASCRYLFPHSHLHFSFACQWRWFSSNQYELVASSSILSPTPPRFRLYSANSIILASWLPNWTYRTGRWARIYQLHTGERLAVLCIANANWKNEKMKQTRWRVDDDREARLQGHESRSAICFLIIGVHRSAVCSP